MGVLIRPASIVLLIFAAIGIYGFQWDLQNGVQPDQIISALNEVSIVGGLLFLLAESGSGTFQLAKGGMVDGRT
jgi:uncharacterized membrane protein YphA (DoxX/SURF4 family)